MKFYKGIAGVRPGKCRGIVFHNDAGSNNATPSWYAGWLRDRDALLGFAHVYQTAKDRLQWEDYGNKAWHCADGGDGVGNTFYVGWEVCQSEGDLNQFLANEVAVIKDIAKFMKAEGLPVNRETVRLHHEFSSTDCPRRSMEIHTGNGRGRYTAAQTNQMKDYLIAEILKYQGQGGGAVPNPTPSPTPGGFTVEPWNRRQSVDVPVLNVRAAQTSESGIVGTLTQGQTFNATRICRNGKNVNGYTTWFEVNGRGWVSGAYVTEIAGGSAPAPAPAGGTYTFRNVTNVRDRPSLSGTVVAQYQPGQSVVYDQTVQADGYTWMGYIGGSGKRRWVAKTN